MVGLPSPREPEEDGIVASGRPGPGAVERLRRLERGLAGLRWLVVAFGVAYTVATLRQEPGNPGFTVPLSYVLLGALGLGNVALTSAALRAREVRQLRAIGLAAFALDLAVVTGMVWNTARPGNSAWVATYILSLEGAVRYGLPGALAPVAIAALSEPLRELWLADLVPSHEVDPAALAFRLSVQLVVALVAGLMARSLEREASTALARAAEAEEAARVAEEAAARMRELDQMKSDFVAITSHELRTPLSSIRGFVDTLRRRLGELSEEEVREFLDIVALQGERLTRLVEDLLVASKIEAGRMTLVPEVVQLRPFLEGARATLGEGAVRVRLAAADDLPAAIVIDPHRLGQVLTNLLANALKFSPPDTPVVLRARRDGDRLALAVSDRGPGIAEEERERVFERFHQTGGAGDRAGEGFGLGLYIAKRLVEAMEGDLELDSEVGRGSTFTVRLPVAEVPAGQISPRPPGPSPRSGAARAG